jgi:hypothetical protein
VDAAPNQPLAEHRYLGDHAARVTPNFLGGHMIFAIAILTASMVSFYVGQTYGMREEQKIVASLLRAYDVDKARATEIYDEVVNRVKKFL